jgi:hypothetical protein
MKRVERNKRLKNVALKILIVYNNCNKSDITSKYQAQPGSRAHFSAIYQSRPMAKYQSQPTSL